MHVARVLKAVIVAVVFSQIAAPAFAINEYMPTWYFGLRGSVNTLKANDLGTTPMPATKYDPGFGAGADFGVILPHAFYQPLAGLHLEVEISRFWQEIDNARVDLSPPVLSFDGAPRPFDVTAYMANVYYYFPGGLFSGLLRPYLGGGIGWADTRLKRNLAAPSAGDNTDSVAAWQGMAGFSYSASDEALTEWNVGYRYFTTNNPTYDDGFGGKTIVENRIHALELGVRFRY